MCWFGNVHLMEPYAKTCARGHCVLGTMTLLCLGLGPECNITAHCQMGRAGQGSWDANPLLDTAPSRRKVSFPISTT